MANNLPPEVRDDIGLLEGHCESFQWLTPVVQNVRAYCERVTAELVEMRDARDEIASRHLAAAYRAEKAEAERDALLESVQEMGGSLANGEWENVLSTDDDVLVLDSEISELVHDRDALRSEINAVSGAIGTTRYMDPPDGGDVELSEQVLRMRVEVDALRDRLVNAHKATASRNGVVRTAVGALEPHGRYALVRLGDGDG